MTDWRKIPGVWLRILTFQSDPDDWEFLNWRFLAAGLAVTWLAGIGRYWDDSRAKLLQSLGLGSLVYVFVLSLLLWIILKPLLPRKFTYVRILTFVSLTSPPALLYAIPVEIWFSLETSNMINLIFLGVVALWRLALFGLFLIQFGRMGWLGTLVCLTAPLAVILVALTALNLHHVIINVMGGIREADKSSQDTAFFFTALAAYLSVPVSIASGLVWLVLCGLAFRDRLKQKRGADSSLVEGDSQ